MTHDDYKMTDCDRTTRALASQASCHDLFAPHHDTWARNDAAAEEVVESFPVRRRVWNRFSDDDRRVQSVAFGFEVLNEERALGRYTMDRRVILSELIPAALDGMSDGIIGD